MKQRDIINENTIKQYSALQKRDKEIKELERIASANGVDLGKIKEQAKTTVYDYKSLLLNAISQ